MDQKTFVSYMYQARSISTLNSQDYYSGYMRGLRRRYHGEKFGTIEEHERFMRLGQNGDTRIELGRGYRDGFAGKTPQEVLDHHPQDHP